VYVCVGGMGLVRVPMSRCIRHSLPPCGHLGPKRVIPREHPLSSFFGCLPEIQPAQSTLLQWSLVTVFLTSAFSLFLASGKGKLLKASKILYSEKISTGIKRSGSRERLLG
jgi:hypothetical protein